MIEGHSRRTPAQVDYLFPLMVDSVRDYAIFLLDTSGFVQTWNAGAERIKGYRADEIIGQHFSQFYPAADLRAGKPEYELAVAIEQGRFEDEGWRIRKDGTAFWANVIITAVRDHDGVLLGFGKVTRDLTERKRAEDERILLLEAERTARIEAERARARVEAMHAITEASLPHVDLKSLLTAVLARVCDVLSADTAVALLREGDVLVPIASAGLETGPTDSVPVGAGFAGRIAAQGSPIIVDDIKDYQLWGTVLSSQGVRSLLGVPLIIGDEIQGVLHVGNRSYRRFLPDDVALLQVVADRVILSVDHARAVEAERAARSEWMAAQEAARLRDEFLAVAAHELKTPEASLRLSVQLAVRRLESGDIEKTREFLQETMRQVDRLDRLVTQLLDVSRLNADRFAVEPEETDIVTLVTEAARLISESSNHAVHLDLPESLVAQVDGLRFGQIVTNLIDNAAKYGANDDRPIEVGLRREGDELLFSVRDHGAGIPAGRRDKLFERFYQAHARSYQSGLGLGLFITRSIAREHGGDVTADFPEDGGTRFLVRIPMRQPPVDRAATAETDVE